MSSKSSSLQRPTSLRVARPGNDNSIYEYERYGEDVSLREKQMQIVSFSMSVPFKLPDDWFVEKKPRPSNPSHVDKIYHEPGTGRKFRSLIAVQRYLTEDTRNFCTTERMISEGENNMQVITHTRESTSFTKLPDDWIVEEKPRNSYNYAGVIDKTYIAPGTGQRFRSLRAVHRYLSGESVLTATPKAVVRPCTGKQVAPGVKRYLKDVKKRPSVAEEDKITLKAPRCSTQFTDSKKSDSQKKISSGKNSRGSIHNLSGPPAKVTWVLSGPGGFWTPFVDDTIVPESEKLKWSEAFVLSIHDGIIKGF